MYLEVALFILGIVIGYVAGGIVREETEALRVQAIEKGLKSRARPPR